MALIPGLTNSLSGMKTAQNQLELIGKNIANADTPGYTRKIAKQYTPILAGFSGGVALNQVQRTVDEGLLKSFLGANSASGSLNAKNLYLSKAELLLGTPQGNDSISANVANLQSAFNTFATDVTSAAGRYNLLSNAQTVTARLNSLTTEIQRLRGDADVSINGAVNDINQLLDSLDRLNENIVKYNILGYDGVADLEDQRDQALRDLSEKIDITYFKRDTGEIMIQTKSGVTLLDNDPHKLSHSAVSQTSPSSTYAGGEIGGIMVDGVDITNKISEGELKGLIETRDVTLPSLQSQLDEMAGVLKKTINEIHNQGTAYPATPSSLTGTRSFADSARQRIQIEGGDVRFTIFGKDGKQIATTSLGGDLGFTEGTVDDMTNRLQTWLRDPNGANLPQAVARINDDGQFVIDTGDSEYSVSIMDQTTSTAGADQQSVKVKFAGNGSTNYDREYSGFSNFFGMNDFFTTQSNESIYDSKVLSSNVNLGLRAPATISFSDKEHGLNFGSITVIPGESLQDIVNKVNNDPTLNQSVRASLVPNGSGYMLRIVNTSGQQLDMSESRRNGDPSSGLLERLGMAPSNTLTAGSITVRDDLVSSPSLIAAGLPEFNKNTGEYQLNPAANNIANGMGKVFSTSQSFNQSGTIAQSDTTLSNYAATFVGNIASQTRATEESLAYQNELTNSISTKEAKISGVDVDEELGYMIMFQQTYAACAKAFTASKEMLDMLLGLV